MNWNILKKHREKRNRQRHADSLIRKYKNELWDLHCGITPLSHYANDELAIMELLAEHKMQTGCNIAWNSTRYRITGELNRRREAINKANHATTVVLTNNEGHLFLFESRHSTPNAAITAAFEELKAENLYISGTTYKPLLCIKGRLRSQVTWPGENTPTEVQMQHFPAPPTEEKA